jgi:threonyl-tRNA synthetase
MMKVPYLLVVGEKEETNKTVNVRDRKGEEKEIPLAEFIKKIEDEIKEKAL